MKKVLIITYYWPPSGGAGVQRWLKFVKYLKEFGWQPIVYTSEKGESPAIDHTLLKDVPRDLEVLKHPIWEPYSIYKKFVGQKKEEKINAGFLSENKKPKISEKLSVWIRGNLFIPDARKFWIAPSIKFLSHYLINNPVDAIVSTGPPHSMHLIALGLKKKFNIPWLADFRDPWTNIDFYEDLMLTKWADKKHHRLEKDVITNASCVVTIGETMKKEFLALGANNVEVITNGYDDEDLYKGELELDKKFSIAHVGTLVKSRNPEILWKVLSLLVEENEMFKHDLEIKLAGKVDVNVNQSIEKYGLQNFVNRIDYLPHNEIIKVQQQSQILLLLLNNTKNAKGILTGKFFEYIAAKRPILCIGPVDGDAANIINKTSAGKVVGFTDEVSLKKEILQFYQLYKSGQLTSGAKGIEKYSRKELTKELVKVLNDIAK